MMLLDSSIQEKGGGLLEPCPSCVHPCEPTSSELGGYRLFLCKNCDLHFAPRAFEVPVAYDDAYMQGLYPDQAIEAMREKEAHGLDATKIATYVPFFRGVKPRQHDRLLDVGCGGGRFCRAASGLGWKTTGVDVSKAALTAAIEAAPLEYHCIELDKIREELGTFDVVTAFEVLEHQANLHSFLESIINVLEPGGKFFCTVPAWEDPAVRAAVRADWIPPVHLLFFSRTALVSSLYNVGFEILKSGYIPGVPLRLYDKCKWLARNALHKNQRRRLGIWALARSPKLAKS